MSPASLKSLSRINVRVVTAASFCAALFATGVVVWRLSSWHAEYTTADPPSRISVSHRGEWQGSESDRTPWADDSPFSSDYLKSQLRQRAEARAKAAAQRKQNPPKSTTAPRQPPPRTPPARQRTIALIYRGMLTRTDGSSVAILERTDTRKTVLLKRGESTEGLALKRLDRSVAALGPADGESEHVLPIGKRIVITVDDRGTTP